MKKPVAITFADKKMLYLAEQQKENFNSFGIEHIIYSLDDVELYDTALWLKLIDLTVDAINKYDKILRLDAEVRIHKNLSEEWLQSENVLFQPLPVVKKPFYVAINTGQIILSKSGLKFLHILKECMLSMIPPDNDTSLPHSGNGNYVEDEWPSCMAIRLSKIKFKQEYLCYDRRLNANCSANRGLWVESNTILTHPGIHNWELIGAGQFWKFDELNYGVFINHFNVTRPINEVEFIAKLILNRNSNNNIWNKIAYKIDDNHYKINDWIFNPKEGLVAIEGRSFKLLKN